MSIGSFAPSSEGLAGMGPASPSPFQANYEPEIEVDFAHGMYRGVIHFEVGGRLVRRRLYDPLIWNLVRRLVSRMRDYPIG